MRADAVEIHDQGRNVNFRIRATDLDAAHRAHKYADENHPEGYILLTARISRRAKGGRTRWLTLSYRHTGNEHHAPEMDAEEWRDLLVPERIIAGGGPAPLDREARTPED